MAASSPIGKPRPDDWQANNVTDELRARGLRTGSRVAKIQDFNFGLGGPIKKDKLWFFANEDSVTLAPR